MKKYLNKNRKGFTLIELIVVMAIIGVLVLLAAPRFLNYTNEAKLTQIKNDVKAVEGVVTAYMATHKQEMPKNGTVADKSDLEKAVEDGMLYNTKGKIVDNNDIKGSYFEVLDKAEVVKETKTKLNGEFIINEDGVTYYIHDKVIKIPSGKKPVDSGDLDGDGIPNDEDDNICVPSNWGNMVQIDMDLDEEFLTMTYDEGIDDFYEDTIALRELIDSLKNNKERDYEGIYVLEDFKTALYENTNDNIKYLLIQSKLYDGSNGSRSQETEIYPLEYYYAFSDEFWDNFNYDEMSVIVNLGENGEYYTDEVIYGNEDLLPKYVMDIDADGAKIGCAKKLVIYEIDGCSLYRDYSGMIQKDMDLNKKYKYYYEDNSSEILKLNEIMDLMYEESSNSYIFNNSSFALYLNSLNGNEYIVLKTLAYDKENSVWYKHFKIKLIGERNNPEEDPFETYYNGFYDEDSDYNAYELTSGDNSLMPDYIRSVDENGKMQGCSYEILTFIKPVIEDNEGAYDGAEYDYELCNTDLFLNYTGDEYKYIINDDGTITISEYVGDGNGMKIPGKIDGRIVTSIGNPKSTQVTSTKYLYNVEFPCSTQSVNKNAFHLRNISSLTVPGNIKSIGEGAFAGSNIYSLILEEGIEHIGKEAFAANTIGSLTLPNSLKHIEEYAFANNQLRGTLIIPDSVERIEKGAFEGYALNTNWRNRLSEVIIGKNVEFIGERAFYYNGMNNLTIKSDKLQEIDTEAFYENKIVDLILPNSVVTIGESAFEHNELKSVVLSNDLKTIGRFAFSQNNINSLVIPDKVERIEDWAFSNNSLESLFISKSVSYLGGRVFSNNKLLTNIIVDNLNKNYKSHNNAIYNSDGTVLIFGAKTATNNILPTTITIGDNAFTGMGVDSVTIPDGVENIGESAFQFNNITELYIPNNVKAIGSSAFNNNKLLFNSVIIDNTSEGISMNTIGEYGYPFHNNGADNKVSIPATYLR